MELATRGERFRGALADGLIVAIPYLVAGTDSLPTAVRVVGMAGALVVLIVQLVWVIKQGQTIGKKIVGTRIVLKDTLQNGGFVPNVLKRGFVTGLLNMIPGFFIVDSLFIFREDRRCIHDHIAGTCVIKADAVVQ
ncbi:MAG: RDD family protein [Elusimicrobia bacterium]|nr:RDD family protein [Elusimicrobiota bacterium]